MMNPEFILVVLQGLPLLSGGIFAILMKNTAEWVVEIVTKCFRKKSIDEIPRDFYLITLKNSIFSNIFCRDADIQIIGIERMCGYDKIITA